MVKKLVKVVLGTGTLLLFFIQVGLTQEVKEKEIRAFDLGEVVVTATKSEREVRDLSASVSVITREEIESSNANSATDILNTLPGVFVHKTGPFGRADVEIRGLGGRGRKVMVLIDGRPVKMGLFGCTVTHSLPLDNVERIEVVRGPFSVLYGSDALGGVINIIARRPKEKSEGDFTTSFGDYNTTQYRLRQGGNLGKFNYYLTGDLRSSDGHITNSAYDGKDYTVRIGYKITDTLEATLTGKYFDGSKEEPLRATDPPSPPSDVWNDYERGAVDLTFAGKGEKWSPEFKFYRNFGEHKFSDGWHSQDFTNGAMFDTVRNFSNNELTLGAEFREQGGERLSAPRGDWDKSEYALFFHNAHTFSKKVIFTLGGRFNEDEISGSDFSPQVGFVFPIGEQTILRTAINKGFRSPQLDELYLFPPSNTDLEAEVVWNYELGLNRQIREGIEASLVGYIMQGNNLIQTEKNPTPPPMFKFQNTGEFEFKGIELGLSAQIRKRLSSEIYYTYLDPGDKTTGRPGDKVDLVMKYARKKFNLFLNGQWVADYFAADEREEPISEYFIINTKLSYEVFPGLQAFLAIDNLFDKEYEIYADLPGGAAGLYSMPERTFTAGLNCKF